MFKVDIEKCIGCGFCIKDCFVKDIRMVDGKADIRNITCFKCGHCIAVCPVGAVSTDEYNMADVVEYSKENFEITPDTLLNFIKFRRTVRQFKDMDIENEKLLKIIEAGRFTQTGSNSQNVSYIVIKDKIQELRALVLESLKNLGEYILEASENTLHKRYAKMWLKMHQDFINDPKGEDKLFFKAPAVVLIVSESPVNAALASSNMELMTNALGLGTVFSGFLVRAAEGNEKIREFLKLDGNQQIITAMIIGYPDVSYHRTVPRKDAEITWK